MEVHCYRSPGVVAEHYKRVLDTIKRPKVDYGTGPNSQFPWENPRRWLQAATVRRLGGWVVAAGLLARHMHDEFAQREPHYVLFVHEFPMRRDMQPDAEPMTSFVSGRAGIISVWDAKPSQLESITDIVLAQLTRSQDYRA